MVETSQRVSARRPRAPTRAMYDRLSRWYDWLAGGSEERACRAGLGMLDAQPGQRILDIGCGNGRSLIDLARVAGPAGIACGIDLSAGMCRVARRRVAGAGHDGSPVVVLGDAIELPFRDGAYDAVTMSFALELFTEHEIPVVLRECLRVLRAQGRLCVVSMAQVESRNAAVRLYEWAHNHFPTYVDCRPIWTERVLQVNGYEVDVHGVRRMSIWGLPVDIVRASVP